MAEKLSIINAKVDNRKKQYKADGIIRLSKLNDLEVVLLLETAGSFQIKKNEPKTLLCASDEYLRLWTIQHVNNGIHKYNREDKLKIKVDEEPVQMAKELLDFFNAIKVSLMETSDIISPLKLEEEESEDANS
ncbi:hypothetical protein PS15m_009745 [Mucor circinelloides]